MRPNTKIKLIGIRPGEKIHESLCSKDDSKYTIEFKHHYLIKPSIILNFKNSYQINSISEKGIIVKPNFEYESGRNENFLNIKQIKKFINKHI